METEIKSSTDITNKKKTFSNTMLSSEDVIFYTQLCTT